MQHLFDLYGWEVNVYDTIQQGLINRHILFKLRKVNLFYNPSIIMYSKIPKQLMQISMRLELTLRKRTLITYIRICYLRFKEIH